MLNYRLIVHCLSFIGITYAVPKTALLVIDVQNCFLPGGGLAVPGGEKIIPIINGIRAKYGDKMAATVLSQVFTYHTHYMNISLIIKVSEYDRKYHNHTLQINPRYREE